MSATLDAEKPVKKRRLAAATIPANLFSDCELADTWYALSNEEASAVGKNVKDEAGLGDMHLYVAKLFPLKDGEHDWFLATINTRHQLKHFFWVTFVDDQSEYRVKFYPTNYEKDWYFVKRKSWEELPADEPAADEPYP